MLQQDTLVAVQPDGPGVTPSVSPAGTSLSTTSSSLQRIRVPSGWVAYDLIPTTARSGRVTTLP